MWFKKKFAKIKKLKRKVIVSLGLISSLFFGRVKTASSNLETAHFDNRTVVERVLDLSGGDQSKFGPGARAKADARANAGVRRTGQTASSGSSIFVEGYTPHHIYCNHYHKNGNMPSCRQAHKNICPPDNQGKYLADHPGGSQIMSRVNQLSTNVVPTQTQVSGFVKNGKVDFDKCLSEVQRRASEIGCNNFECSLERFKALATENGNITTSTVREAITILQGEMHGYYTNARRENYGTNITGPDFVVEGRGNFQNITHVEVKNPVGSAIKIANGQKGSISKQGKKIGAKLVYQQNYWSNSTKTSELENLNPTASLPQSPNNVLGAVDNFDVPSSEKAFMEASILKGSQNKTNIIFLNNN